MGLTRRMPNQEAESGLPEPKTAGRFYGTEPSEKEVPTTRVGKSNCSSTGSSARVTELMRAMLRTDARKRSIEAPVGGLG